MPYMVTGDINPDNIGTGTITRNKISTTDGKTEADATTTITKMGYHKTKFKNLRKGSSYDNKSNNKAHPKQYTQEGLNELIDIAITHALQKNKLKDVNEINQHPVSETKSPQKLDWLVKIYEPERYFMDIKSNPKKQISRNTQHNLREREWNNI